MSFETYEPIYHAVQNKLRNCDVGEAVRQAISPHFEQVGYHTQVAMSEIGTAGMEQQRPSVLFRPALTLDGNKYCALFGDNLMQGCAGFGDTAAEAMDDFDKNWMKQKAPNPRGPSDEIEGIRKDLRELSS